MRSSFLVIQSEAVRLSPICISSLQKVRQQSSMVQFRCDIAHSNRSALFSLLCRGFCLAMCRLVPLLRSALPIAASPTFHSVNFIESSKYDLCRVSGKLQTNALSSSTWAGERIGARPEDNLGET